MWAVNSYSIQTDNAICHITVNNLADFDIQYSVHLSHRQLVKGLLTFKLSGMQAVKDFIDGFLFGELNPPAYAYYCEVFRNTFFNQKEIWELFNVYPADHFAKIKIGVDSPRRLR